MNDASQNHLLTAPHEGAESNPNPQQNNDSNTTFDASTELSLSTAEEASEKNKNMTEISDATEASSEASHVNTNASDDKSDDSAEPKKDAQSEKIDQPKSPTLIKDKKAEARLRSEAKKLCIESQKLFKRAKKQLSEDRQKEVLNAIESLEKALQDDKYSCALALANMKEVSHKRLRFARKSGAQEVTESLIFALVFALVLRTFLVEPFKIPTRSMVPTLLEGDQLFVTKLSYGIRLPIYNDYITWFSQPQRGEVIVFAFPREEATKHLMRTNSGCMQIESLAGEKDYIKRIIGVEGDTVEVIDQVIHVNGEPVAQQPIYERTVSDYMYLTDRRKESWNREMHGDATYTTITHELPSSHFGPIKVMPGHVFVMGDNRDNSADSRCWGQVPVKNIKGRAQIIWWSSGHIAPRWERMFTWIH